MRRVLRQDLVEDGAEKVDVGPLVDPIRPPGRLDPVRRTADRLYKIKRV